jgi:hypothetical protein
MFGQGGHREGVVSDNLYAYDLRPERPIIAALVRQAAARYLGRFGDRPVNAVEVGFWVEGARLVVRLISDPAYEFNWITYPKGFGDGRPGELRGVHQHPELGAAGPPVRVAGRAGAGRRPRRAAGGAAG